MKTYKAAPIGSQQIPDLEILAADTVPDCEKLSQAAEIYKEEGEKICNALLESLPGGIFDALLCSMLQRKASMFRVKFND